MCFKRRVEGFLIAALVNLSLQSVKQRRASRALLTVFVLLFSSTDLPMLRFMCMQAGRCGVIVYESILLGPRFYLLLHIAYYHCIFCTTTDVYNIAKYFQLFIFFTVFSILRFVVIM